MKSTTGLALALAATPTERVLYRRLQRIEAMLSEVHAAQLFAASEQAKRGGHYTAMLWSQLNAEGRERWRAIANGFIDEAVP